MNLIAHIQNIYNTKEFEDLIFRNETIDGLSFDLTMTKDDKIIIYAISSNNQVNINTLENSSLNELENFRIYELDTVLSYLKQKKYKKKIFFQFIPLSHIPITEDTIASIRKRNYTYIKTTADIVKKYTTLNLYFSSMDYNLIYYMKELMNNVKIGVRLSFNNLSYVNVDFYEFPSNMLDFTLINQQLNLGKEVILVARTEEDLSLLVKAFKINTNSLVNQLFPKLIFNTNYPEILYLTFREEAK